MTLSDLEMRDTRVKFFSLIYFITLVPSKSPNMVPFDMLGMVCY